MNPKSNIKNDDGVVYVKKNKKYIPIGRYGDWRAFPCDGFWLVTTSKNSHSERCIAKIDSKIPVYPLAKLETRSYDICEFVSKWTREKNKNLMTFGIVTHSIQDFVDDMLKYLAEKDEKNT